MNLQKEFEQQIQNLLQKGYPKESGMTDDEFVKRLEPLRKQLDHVKNSEIDLKEGYLPFVIVVKSSLIPTEKAMSLAVKDGREGITKLFPLEPKDFETIDTLEIPDDQVYLLVDIDRGKDSINIPPSEALKRIVKKNRSPLTIDEGIAILTHFPEFLMKNNCFSLLASRNSKDKRVPAIWINAKKHPNLGWCWDGNPHTWLGSASCGKRIGV